MRWGGQCSNSYNSCNRQFVSTYHNKTQKLFDRKLGLLVYLFWYRIILTILYRCFDSFFYWADHFSILLLHNDTFSDTDTEIGRFFPPILLTILFHFYWTSFTGVIGLLLHVVLFIYPYLNAVLIWRFLLYLGLWLRFELLFHNYILIHNCSETVILKALFLVGLFSILCSETC